MKRILLLILMVSANYISNGQTDCAFSIIPNDTTITISANQFPLTINLTTDIEADSYCWLGATGLSDDSVRNPVLTITSAGTYQYVLETKTLLPQNLITNGDFEAGNTGFS